jgi:hypothetical protein
VPWVVANHEHNASPADDLTVLTNTLDAGADFHGLFDTYLQKAIGPKRLNISPNPQLVQVPSARKLSRQKGLESRLFAERVEGADRLEMP